MHPIQFIPYGVAFFIILAMLRVIFGTDRMDVARGDKREGRSLSMTFTNEEYIAHRQLKESDHRYNQNGVQYRPVAWGFGENETVIKYEEVME